MKDLEVSQERREREREMEIEEETRVQAASPTWFSQRAGRITASIGPIVNFKKKEITEKFIKKTSLIKKNPFTSTPTSN